MHYSILEYMTTSNVWGKTDAFYCIAFKCQRMFTMFNAHYMQCVMLHHNNPFNPHAVFLSFSQNIFDLFCTFLGEWIFFPLVDTCSVPSQK